MLGKIYRGGRWVRTCQKWKGMDRGAYAASLMTKFFISKSLCSFPNNISDALAAHCWIMNHITVWYLKIITCEHFSHFLWLTRAWLGGSSADLTWVTCQAFISVSIYLGGGGWKAGLNWDDKGAWTLGVFIWYPRLHTVFVVFPHDLPVGLVGLIAGLCSWVPWVAAWCQWLSDVQVTMLPGHFKEI